MKVAILTLTPKENYGGILQATALYNFLKKRNHDVILINKKPCISFFKKSLIYLLERIPFQNIRDFRRKHIKEIHLKPFINKNIQNISPPIHTKLEMQDFICVEGFDAVIVGSDQVWRFQYIADNSYSCYFLDFSSSEKDIRKIAYAASFGKDYWEAPQKTTQIKKLIKNFHAISTREMSGVDICKNIFDYDNCENALDPTLLMGVDFYNNILNNKSSTSSVRKITTYILDDSTYKKSIVDTLSDEIERVDLSDFKENGNPWSVEEWLWHIKTAETIITDSFHGMVFSIIFNKNFIVIGNQQRGLERFNSLLNLIGLESRLKKDTSPLEEIKLELSKPINYEEINKTLDIIRAKSISFIDRNII